jgi:hypothetical protein
MAIQNRCRRGIRTFYYFCTKKNTVCLRYRHERERKRRLRYFEKEIGPYSQADGKNRIQIGRTCKETRCLARTLSAP